MHHLFTPSLLDQSLAKPRHATPFLAVRAAVLASHLSDQRNARAEPFQAFPAPALCTNASAVSPAPIYIYISIYLRSDMDREQKTNTRTVSSVGKSTTRLECVITVPISPNLLAGCGERSQASTTALHRHANLSSSPAVLQQFSSEQVSLQPHRAGRYSPRS